MSAMSIMVLVETSPNDYENIWGPFTKTEGDVRSRW